MSYIYTSMRPKLFGKFKFEITSDSPKHNHDYQVGKYIYTKFGLDHYASQPINNYYYIFLCSKIAHSVHIMQASSIAKEW